MEKIYQTPTMQLIYCNNVDVLTGSTEGDQYAEDIFGKNE